MNIFHLDNNLEESAKAHCDQHVRKMLIEYTQILCMNYRYHVGTPGKLYLERKKKIVFADHPYVIPEDEITDYNPFIYIVPKAHINHPSTIWARTSLSNTMWLLELTKQVSNEWTYRYKKPHRTQKILQRYIDLLHNYDIPDIGLTKLTLAMPEEYFDDDPVKAYRNFYIFEKTKFAKWEKGRPAPIWIQNN